MESGHSGMTLNFWQRVIKERQEEVSTRFLRKYQGSGQDVNVCVLVEHQVTRLQ
jgi:hypothetical protein